MVTWESRILVAAAPPAVQGDRLFGREEGGVRRRDPEAARVFIGTRLPG